MINQTEKDEKEYLEEIKEKLQLAIGNTETRVRQQSEELRQKKQYIYENQSGMDEADMVAADQSINRMVNTGESVVSRKKRLMKLGRSPWFARIDFNTAGERIPIYIGIHSFADESTGKNLIYDWRAPVSSMFYDFELGNASYTTPGGLIKGELVLKRQYKIREGVMEYMIESGMNIQDDMLQKELSKTSDDKMKNIVATIQRDQNAVIRNETASVMIIQGVAGSGKTSIALHRIAFLLYRFRDTIKAKDVLIISPNKVFADYISNVLPELGESHIPEMGMEELASELLQNKYQFQTFFRQVSTLLDRHDEAYVERIKFKSSFEFLSKLNQYMIYLENNFFDAKEIKIGGTVIPFPFIQEKLKSYHRLPLLSRFPEVISDVLQEARQKLKRKVTGHEKAKVWQMVPQMVRMSNNVFDLYRDFYKWIGKEEMFKPGHNGQLEWSDVYPLIYCRIRLEGIKVYEHVKHLLVDEMQDYTPVQYSVLSRLFTCKKTILGDVSQTVNPYSSSSAEIIEEVFPQGEVVKLFRSYRSTWEITAFAQKIRTNPNIIPMERHGEQPEVRGFHSPKDEIDSIRQKVKDFESSGSQSMGIICKTHQQAEMVHRELKGFKTHLLTPDSTTFLEGIVITTAHLAKGLEFDEVIVPNVTDRNYQSDVDKSMLYIACTRAMHRLTLTYSGNKSLFI